MVRKAYTAKDVRKSLTKKGFAQVNSHHAFLFLFIDGKKTGVRTKVSHGRKDYSGPLWTALKKQLRLDSDDLELLLDCGMSEDDYISRLKESGVLDQRSGFQ